MQLLEGTVQGEVGHRDGAPGGVHQFAFGEGAARSAREGEQQVHLAFGQRRRPILGGQPSPGAIQHEGSEALHHRLP